MDSSDDTLSASQAQRTKLLSTTDKLTQGQRRLEDSHRIALETEDVGSGILRDLRGQRETLVHTRDNVRTFRRALWDFANFLRYDSAVRSGWIDRQSFEYAQWNGQAVSPPHHTLYSLLTRCYRMYQQKLVTYGIIAILVLLM